MDLARKETSSMDDYLKLPEWDKTRPIYRKLSDEFHVLTGAYSLVVDERTKLMLDHIILGIDEVDLVVDQLASEQERTEITDSILNYLISDEKAWDHHLAPASLIIKIQTIKSIVQELDVVKRFHTAAAIIFDYTEQKRHTKEEGKLIEFVKKEGRATAELPLSIMRIEANHPFGQFFTGLCKLMGVADLVIDAKSDYRSNYISLKPKLSLYFKLNAILVKEGLKLIWNFPRKLSFLIYCIKFSVLLLITED